MKHVGIQSCPSTQDVVDGFSHRTVGSELVLVLFHPFFQPVQNGAGMRFSFLGSLLPVQLLFPHPLFQCIEQLHFIEHMVGLSCIIPECIDKVTSGMCPRDNRGRLYRKSAGYPDDFRKAIHRQHSRPSGEYP
jgi:hypothetical protein